MNWRDRDRSIVLPKKHRSQTIRQIGPSRRLCGKYFFHVLGRQPNGEFFLDDILVKAIVPRFLEQMQHEAERAQGEKLLPEKALAAIDVGIQKPPAKFGQKHLIFRSVEKTKQFPGFHDRNRVPEIVFGKLIELEDIDLAAVIADDFHQPEDVTQS